MIDFDFADGLKIVLVTIFMLGSVQLHAVIDDSVERADARAERVATQQHRADRDVSRASDSFDAGEQSLRRGLAARI